jgi:hypothetical protein
MFSGFSLMLQAIFRALTKLAQGTEKFAGAFDELGGVAEQTAKSFADQAAMEREAKLAIMRHNATEQAKALAATQGQVALPATAQP